MDKIITFLRYTKDFIKHGEFRYILSSIRYIVKGKTTRRSRYYTSSLGRFWVRKGTLDFQFANYAYEWGVKQFVYKHVNDYNLFIDVGANIGTYSILFANKGLHGFAFEPVVSNYEALTRNIHLNKFEDRVTTFPFALGIKEGTAEFTFDPINTGASHLSENSDFLEDVVNPEFENIKIKSFDSIEPTLNIKPDDKVFIKIDVEGMEEKVLNGATKFLSKHKNILIVLESKHSGRDDIKKLLSSIANFEFLDVDDYNMAAKKIS